MSKVYSNKALPAGTVLREWRLEEVLGVGGFGIVYKARGIYFDELVAIKEYFPSSISERQEDDTIVPVDSDAEEVHALGLKKFVEEAKLLWNLSTPSRHPNIVSVRSLFEIHGSAYMVMDFEDGVSLSKMLKEGRRFNQASLTSLILPIAEGLERAHRVGVLHRDIKPANMLVTPEGRSVLIDFGSARFESGEATSTTVTFHTPPYAAIEQYVKTYEQGPWTDVYALGVVLYECVTGEKPAEVLERLHGNADKPLSNGNWPGFSRSFLAAIDAAMTIRPDDRPRSISEWLALFERSDDEVGAPLHPPVPDDDDATRITPFVTLPSEIQPVAPPLPDFETTGTVRTNVPDRPSQASFKRAGEDTRGKAAEPASREPPAEGRPEGQGSDASLDAAPASPGSPVAAGSAAPPAAKPAAAKPAREKSPVKPPATGAGTGKSRKPMLLAAVAGVMLVGVAGAWFAANRGPDSAAGESAQTGGVEAASEASLPAAQVSGTPLTQDPGAMLLALAVEAKAAGMPAGTVAKLEGVGKSLTAADANPVEDPAAAAKAGLAQFVGAIAADTYGKAVRTARDLPWADSGRPAAAAREGPQKRQIAASLSRSRAEVNAAAAAIATAPSLDEAAALTRRAMASSRSFSLAVVQAYRVGPAGAAVAIPQQAEVQSPAAAQSAPAKPAAEANTAGGGVSPATKREFDSVVASARQVAAQVVRLGERGRPGSNASDAEKEGYRTRQRNAQSAKSYQGYLDTLAHSMVGTNTEGEARQSVGKASQTLSYLNTLLSSSRATQ